MLFSSAMGQVWTKITGSAPAAGAGPNAVTGNAKVRPTLDMGSDYSLRGQYMIDNGSAAHAHPHFTLHRAMYEWKWPPIAPAFTSHADVGGEGKGSVVGEVCVCGGL